MPTMTTEEAPTRVRTTREYAAPRRDEVLALLNKGLTARQIQRELDLSSARVYQHLKELRKRGLIT